MAYTVEVTKRAERDIRDAALWYSRYSIDKALEWEFGCNEAIASLAEMPARCPVAPESQENWREVRHLLYEDHRILFEVEDETVTILHVRHQKQKPLAPDEL